MERDDLDQTTNEHAIILLEILECEMLDAVQLFKQHISNRDITFDHAWMIFQPGCMVASTSEYGPAAFELQRAEYEEAQVGKILRLYCKCLHWHGGQYCRKMVNIDLFEFEGTRKIRTLEAFPITFADDKEHMKSRLEDQGRCFESSIPCQYKA
jgi:hypothetical protein